MLYDNQKLQEMQDKNKRNPLIVRTFVNGTLNCENFIQSYNMVKENTDFFKNNFDDWGTLIQSMIGMGITNECIINKTIENGSQCKFEKTSLGFLKMKNNKFLNCKELKTVPKLNDIKNNL